MHPHLVSASSPSPRSPALLMASQDRVSLPSSTRSFLKPGPLA